MSDRLPIPDTRQPVEIWSARLLEGVALFAIGFLVVVWALGEVAA